MLNHYYLKIYATYNVIKKFFYTNSKMINIEIGD